MEESQALLTSIVTFGEFDQFQHLTTTQAIYNIFLIQKDFRLAVGQQAIENKINYEVIQVAK